MGCSLMHFSISGGGARGILFAAFFDELDRQNEALRKGIRSMSGSSAGALVAVPIAMGVDSSIILKTTIKAGRSTLMRLPRALEVYMKWWDAMYSGDQIQNYLMSVCRGKRVLLPVTLSVTDAITLRQENFTWDGRHAASAVVNCAVASAAVPGLFEERNVNGRMYYDGGAVVCTFPKHILVKKITSGEEVIMLNSTPWPGYRISQGGPKQRILTAAIDTFNTHGLEWISQVLGKQFKYKDGCFRYKNVTFLAPTGEQYLASGGTASAGNIYYSENSDFVRQLVKEGRAIANSFIGLHCNKNG